MGLHSLLHDIRSVWYDTDRIEFTASNISSIDACVFIATGYLPSRYIATFEGHRQAESKVVS
jgi:hypothetical protein